MEAFLQLESVVYTDQYRLKVDISGDGEIVIVQGPHLDGIQLRRYDDLHIEEVLEKRGEGVLTPNGRWLVFGDVIYDLQTREWEKFDEVQEEYKLLSISPNSHYLGYTTSYEYEVDWITIYALPFSKGGRKVCYPQEVCDTRDYLMHISKVDFSADNQWGVCCCGIDLDVPPGWMGNVFVISTQKEKIKWRVSIEAQQMVDEEAEERGNYLFGYLLEALFVGEEVVCVSTKGLLVFLDAETGEFIRSMKLDVRRVYEMKKNHDGTALVIRTDKGLQFVPIPAKTQK
ncbi:hypothetical protein [Thermoflavimicrobium dichotomicum]|uniref:Uncharacterized protein n=1 Tax=Thermoflavimicrobium dichotomicum TaxID=46223 RepID=A0A1I3T5K9_9BACL|nr:hypothetical protein [Thermoflavimicrobium dichotomicum]SFJ66428.1 hypothetical protein SAMN05421852_11624 [Thermoflavimicrobium dichotomicum]